MGFHLYWIKFKPNGALVCSFVIHTSSVLSLNVYVSSCLRHNNRVNVIHCMVGRCEMARNRFNDV